MLKWNVRFNKSGEMWFRFFVHAKSSARKGMKMPIKKKPVHIRIIWVSGILRSLRECIRHSISRSNLEWARDLEEKSWRRIWNPFAPELTWDTLKLSYTHIYIYKRKVSMFWKIISSCFSCSGKRLQDTAAELDSKCSNRYIKIVRMRASLFRIVFESLLDTESARL